MVRKIKSYDKVHKKPFLFVILSQKNQFPKYIYIMKFLKLFNMFKVTKRHILRKHQICNQK